MARRIYYSDHPAKTYKIVGDKQDSRFLSTFDSIIQGKAGEEVANDNKRPRRVF